MPYLGATTNRISSSHSPPSYVGRFAPSPTGPLHMGSLIAALASFLDAKAHRGQWLLRMEDLDPPREEAGAAEAILHCLQQHGLHWDGDLLWQSQRHEAYAEAIHQLISQQQAFYCHCSRSQLQKSGGIYPGNCRTQHQKTAKESAIRLEVKQQNIDFIDAIQGHYQQQLTRDVGDFVIQRKDTLYAYQLAVVVDDEYQKITHIVRGSDLLDSTPRQIFLQQQLHYSTPHYAHIPVLTNSCGQKFSKQSHSVAIDNRDSINNLLTALQALNQSLPAPNLCTDVTALIDFSIAHWNAKAIPTRMAITLKNRP